MNKKSHSVSHNAIKIVNRASDGLFSFAVDMILWSAIFTLEVSSPFQSSGKVWRSGIEADKFLQRFNYEIIKTAMINAKRRGFIKKSKRHTWPEITEAGKRRLSNIVPMYDERRTWDKRLHVITYDIPEKQRKQRYLLRSQLEKIGCGRLQDSVWITPYNPIDTLRRFIEEHKLGGTVIISDMGKEGSVGEEHMHDLMVRIYRLEELNKQYEDWLEDNREEVDHYAIIQYLSILKHDPQLPFELLPSWWKGDKAYRQIQSVLKRVSLNFRPAA